MTMSVPVPNPYAMLQVPSPLGVNCQTGASQHLKQGEDRSSAQLLFLGAFSHLCLTNPHVAPEAWETSSREHVCLTTAPEPLGVALHSLLCCHLGPPLILLKTAGLQPGRDGVAAEGQADLASIGWQRLADLH